MVKKGIAYKDINGEYTTTFRVFKSEEDFSNWYDNMSKSGFKIISIIDCNN